MIKHIIKFEHRTILSEFIHDGILIYQCRHRAGRDVSSHKKDFLKLFPQYAKCKFIEKRIFVSLFEN